MLELLFSSIPNPRGVSYTSAASYTSLTTPSLAWMPTTHVKGHRRQVFLLSRQLYPPLTESCTTRGPLPWSVGRMLMQPPYHCPCGSNVRDDRSPSVARPSSCMVVPEGGAEFERADLSSQVSPLPLLPLANDEVTYVLADLIILTFNCFFVTLPTSQAPHAN